MSYTCVFSIRVYITKGCNYPSDKASYKDANDIFTYWLRMSQAFLYQADAKEGTSLCLKTLVQVSIIQGTDALV